MAGHVEPHLVGVVDGDELTDQLVASLVGPVGVGDPPGLDERELARRRLLPAVGEHLLPFDQRTLGRGVRRILVRLGEIAGELALDAEVDPQLRGLLIPDVPVEAALLLEHLDLQVRRDLRLAVVRIRGRLLGPCGEQDRGGDDGDAEHHEHPEAQEPRHRVTRAMPVPGQRGSTAAPGAAGPSCSSPRLIT